LPIGFPSHDPQVYELYWSKSQVAARAHPRLLTAQEALLSLWFAAPGTQINLSTPITYADRLRIRQPGDASFALGPHLDGGSVERWVPDGYGKSGGTYERVFAGNWEEWDPLDATARTSARSSLYESAGGCSIFRAFQGWLAMSSIAPKEGTLLVHPLLQEAMAYILLRPFFHPLRERSSCATETEYLSFENWALEDPVTSIFHGATPGHGQEVNPEWHPHLHLDRCMVHIGHVEPGDYVVWHCDSIHAVDSVHSGKEDSSVLYIPICPLTAINAEYLSHQRDAFAAGTPAPDFPGGRGESEHSGRATVEWAKQSLSAKALQSMGLEG
jgi:Protein of unknown function (DUF1479)